MKLFSYGQSWRRTPVGFLVEAALLSLLLWLPKLLSWDVVPAIELSIVVSVVYLVWTTGAAAGVAQVGMIPSIGFTIFYFVGSFGFAVLLGLILEFLADGATGRPNVALLAYVIMGGGLAFVASVGVVWLAVACLLRSRDAFERVSRTRLGLLLPVAFVTGLAVATVPIKGSYLYLTAALMAAFEMTSYAPPVDEINVGDVMVNEVLNQAPMQEQVLLWLWSLPFGAILFVAHERALTAALSRLYGSEGTVSACRRNRLLWWLAIVPSVVAVLWIYWIGI